LGIAEAGNFPTSIKTVALWFPKKERALATSLFNSGANVGPIIAPIIFPWIALTWSWQAAFIIAGLQAWSIVIAKFMTDPVWWFFLIWLPDYFKKTRHLDIQHSWIHLAAIYAIVTVLSNIGGGLYCFICDLRFCLSGGIRVEPPVSTQVRAGTFRTAESVIRFPQPAY
jgi:ACS family hexuronate transporter-like MFS transporter